MCLFTWLLECWVAWLNNSLGDRRTGWRWHIVLVKPFSIGRKWTVYFLHISKCAMKLYGPHLVEDDHRTLHSNAWEYCSDMWLFEINIMPFSVCSKYVDLLWTAQPMTSGVIKLRLVLLIRPSRGPGFKISKRKFRHTLCQQIFRTARNLLG